MKEQLAVVGGIIVVVLLGFFFTVGVVDVVKWTMEHLQC